MDRKVYEETSPVPETAREIPHNSPHAEWPHFPGPRESFPGGDYGPATGIVIFDIGENRYRLIAVVNFEKQAVSIQEVLTHENLNRRP